MSQESDVCCTTSMYDIQNRCIPDEIDLFYFKTCVITHNNKVIEQNINISMFNILSVKEPHTKLKDEAPYTTFREHFVTQHANYFHQSIIRLQLLGTRIR